MTPIVQFLKVLGSLLRSGRMSYGDALTRFRAQFGRPAEGMEKAAIMKEVEKAPSNVIEFPKDRITDWWKPRPTEAQIKARMIKENRSNVQKSYLRQLDESIMETMELTRKDLDNMSSTALDDLRRSADPVGMRKQFDEITEGRGVGDFADDPDFFKDDYASGGIAGQLHLYDGGRARFFKGEIVTGLAKGAAWFIKNFKSLIDEAANPGPWSRFSKMGAKDKQAAIADAKEMIKRLEAGDSVPEYLLEDIVANPKFKLKRTKATDPDLAEVENLAEGYNRLKLARANKFRGEIKLSPNDPSGAYSRNASSALDDYELFTPTTTDMFGKPWKGKKNWIKQERAQIKKTQEEIGPAPSSRHPEYRSMVQLRKGLEDRLTALDITEELGGNIKMFDKLRMHNYPTYKNTLDKRDWLMPPGGLKRREAFVIDLGHHTLPPVKKAEGGIAGQLHLNRPGYDNGGTTQIADKETNPYEYDTLEYWEWYLDKSMSRDPRYMGYWGTAHINDLIKKYEEAGGDALKYKTLFNKQLEKHTEHFESRTPEAQQKWLEREKEELKKNYDRGIIPGQPKDEKSTPIIKTPYEQEIAQGGLAHVLGV